MKKKVIPPYYVINWDTNRDELVFYDIMPYLVDCWNENKKDKKKKIWALWANDIVKETGIGHKVDDTKMPETFEEFKFFVKEYSFYQFWSRCEYEVIVTGWPVQKKEHKLDVYEQIKANLDVVTKHFMSYIKGE